MKFPEIDISYWKIKDREWIVERKAQWPRIEAMLVGPKSSKGKAVIKQYFLKGKMPDWDRFRDWNSSERHLDLFMFIWLHPSWDEAVLTPLRDAYMASDVIVRDDIVAGFGCILRWGINMASQDYTGKTEEVLSNCLHTDGHNELLFKIMMGDLRKQHYDLEFVDQGLGREKVRFNLPKSHMGDLCVMAGWLCVDTMFPINNDMLYQYDQPLEWWCQNCRTEENYFKVRNHGAQRPYFEKALWRIHNFDTVKEGDTCRTRFVHKMRKILGERELIEDIKLMWGKVKAGEINPQDPWKR